MVFIGLFMDAMIQRRRGEHDDFTEVFLFEKDPSLKCEQYFIRKHEMFEHFLQVFIQ